MVGRTGSSPFLTSHSALSLPHGVQGPPLAPWPAVTSLAPLPGTFWGKEVERLGHRGVWYPIFIIQLRPVSGMTGTPAPQHIPRWTWRTTATTSAAVSEASTGKSGPPHPTGEGCPADGDTLVQGLAEAHRCCFSICCCK